jgi:hypothetical protein
MPVKRANIDGSILFSILFKKGRADKNRLPLAHVVKTLQEVEEMIREVGKQIQREAGVEKPDGDFGIELLAGRSGLVFRKGSVGALSEITRNVEFGIKAISRIIETADVIERKRPVSVDQYNEEILRRLPTVSGIQEKDNTELHLALAHNNRILKKTKFGKKGREVLRSMESAELAIEGITVYGKLRTLRDPSSKDSNGTGYFWGEILEDSGRKWRVRFSDTEQDKVLRLFRKQVCIVGDATYFKTQATRIDATQVHEDPMPDYLTAFDSLREVYADIFPDQEPEDLLKKIRE